MSNAKRRYQEYLNSPQWHDLRAQARARAGNKCEFCGGLPDHVHHVRYPKRFQDDHLDNLVVACEPCHSKLHGVRDELFVDDWIGSAIALEVIDGSLFVRMVFDPMPEDLREPRPFDGWSKKFGAERTKELIDQFDGDVFEIGKSYEKLIPITHELVDKSAYTVADFLTEIIGYLDFPGTKPEISKSDTAAAGNLIIEAFSVGPISCVCRK